MEIEQQIWGATSEGEAVVLYTLRNAAGAEVRLCNVGAAVVSILVPDRDGHLADVALGYKDFRSYFGDPALCGKSIGRVAGCIAYGTMRIDGEEYRLDINGMAGHLNGGVKGFAGRLWESRVETNRVVMSLSSDDGDQGYPGNLQVEAAFDFNEDNALEITYIARTDRTTPVNMACNLLLCLGKLLAGTLFGSIAIMADALNNLSDASSNVVSLIGFRLAAKAPDDPFAAVKADFDGAVADMKCRAEAAGAQLTHLFGFCEEVFGDGQEMLILVTELTMDPSAARFISRYGCGAYFAHNKELLFYERQREILSQLDQLELP